MSTIIRVRDIGKRFTIGAAEARYTTLREAIARAIRKPMNLVSGRGAAQAPTIWALKGISFDVEQGDVVGIVGRNGAGKSTLLKVLSRITEPTTGRAELFGRVGSLLEVGTGFHPELTGRENIFLNGAILGMRRVEIASKFDEIVSFAEVERFIDTPVKHYSSGMYTRLAFAVAAHLNPEILLIDEVLAVGDAQFQRKCLGKMREAGSEGRTVVFVSHNMGAIIQLCKTCLFLDGGELRAHGPTKDVVAAYLRDGAVRSDVDARSFSGPLAQTVLFREIVINGEDGGSQSIVVPSDDVRVVVRGECANAIDDYRTTFAIYRDGVRLLSLHDSDDPGTLPAGPFESTFVIPAFFLRPGEYSIAVGGSRRQGHDWTWGTDLTVFSVMEEWSPEFDKADEGLVNLGVRGVRRSEAAASLVGRGVSSE